MLYNYYGPSKYISPSWPEDCTQAMPVSPVKTLDTRTQFRNKHCFSSFLPCLFRNSQPFGPTYFLIQAFDGNVRLSKLGEFLHGYQELNSGPQQTLDQLRILPNPLICNFYMHRRALQDKLRPKGTVRAKSFYASLEKALCVVTVWQDKVMWDKVIDYGKGLAR